MQKLFWHLAFFGIGIAGLCAQVGAASFDCSKGLSPREKVICANPELSDADMELDRLYKAAMAQLSQDGGMRLQEGQRGWLRYLGRACSASGTGTQSRDLGECLLGQYRERISDLQNAAVQRGPFLFTRTDRYNAKLKRGRVDIYDTGLTLTHVSSPMIDRPVTILTQRWNQLSERELSERRQGVNFCDNDGSGEARVEHSMGLVISRVTSVTWVNSQYCYGSAHGVVSTDVQTLVLLPTPHLMQATDLFRAHTPWKERLSSLLLSAVERVAATAGRDVVDDRAKTSIAAAAALPERWFLRPDGLHVVFNSHELDGYSFAPDIALPWSNLKDVLAMDPLAP